MKSQYILGNYNDTLVDKSKLTERYFKFFMNIKINNINFLNYPVDYNVSLFLLKESLNISTILLYMPFLILILYEKKFI